MSTPKYRFILSPSPSFTLTFKFATNVFRTLPPPTNPGGGFEYDPEEVFQCLNCVCLSHLSKHTLPFSTLG